MKIFVGNLAREVTEEELRKAFDAFGRVESVAIPTDRFTGEARGFGFVDMPADTEARAAIAGLNGKELMGRPLNVNEARPREENRSGGRSFGYRGPSSSDRRSSTGRGHPSGGRRRF